LEEKAGALVGQVQGCAWLTAEDLRPRSHAYQGKRWRTVEDAARSRRRGNRIRGSETGRGGTGSRGARPHGKFFFFFMSARSRASGLVERILAQRGKRRRFREKKEKEKTKER